MDYGNRLLRKDWEIRNVALWLASSIIEKHHYAKRAANTATYLHGLFPKDSFWDAECVGIAWWIPPTKSAAESTFANNWKGVLSLSRLVVIPGIPKNAATFLLAGSMKLIDRKLWPCLVTYADEWRGHTGTIYRAANWKYLGLTKPEAVWTLNDRMIARKAGPHTRTKNEMLALGAKMVGRFSKHKFVHVEN